MKQKARVAVLISGRGSNMVALAEASQAPDFPAQIVAVLADKSDAGGLTKASEMGIESLAVPRCDYADKAAHEHAVQAALEAVSPDIICLAGYMRLLSASFLERWQGRIINIHPSLLPKYRGLNTHERALEAGDTEHGCSVHHVTPGMDEGPVICQATVPILTGDTADDLAARVLIEEHKLYPKALRMLAKERMA
ncbi:MAG: phosphoribosylglycinamide formyltransferase [Pseudomonadota bacterium]